MKPLLTITISLCAILPMQAEEQLPKELDPVEKHRVGSEEIAVNQDELSADVQQLVIEQTNPQVIELLDQVENIMDETTDMLLEADTGGGTIAAQTEIIELIHAAAKKKQQEGGGKSGGAMMDMMERMMGKKPGKGQGKEPGQGEGESNEGGKGQTGDSDSSNTEHNGDTFDASETRRLPKSSGSGSIALPEEFRSALDAYNRGAEKLVK